MTESESMLTTPAQRAKLVETMFKAAYDELYTDDRDPVGPDGMEVVEKVREKLAGMGLILSVEPDAGDESERVSPRISSVRR